VPLIEYTLECLAAAKIREVFVFCCAKKDLLLEYFRLREKRLESVTKGVRGEPMKVKF
jgi:NDP-sugar pyrophosphorylase family protein